MDILKLSNQIEDLMKTLNRQIMLNSDGFNYQAEIKDDKIVITSLVLDEDDMTVDEFIKKIGEK